MTTAVDTRIRFIAKPHTVGRKTTWAVYDRFTGPEPRQRPGVGRIAQDHPDEQAAQDEADRIAAHYAAHPPKEPR